MHCTWYVYSICMSSVVELCWFNGSRICTCTIIESAGTWCMIGSIGTLYARVLLLLSYAVTSNMTFVWLQVRALSWLLYPLPPHVRLIVTTCRSDKSYTVLSRRADTSIVAMPTLSSAQSQVRAAEHLQYPGMMPCMVAMTVHVQVHVVVHVCNRQLSHSCFSEWWYFFNGDTCRQGFVNSLCQIISLEITSSYADDT